MIWDQEWDKKKLTPIRIIRSILHLDIYVDTYQGSVPLLCLP